MDSVTRVHLIRHGQVTGFEQRRYNGHADVALTPYGVEQYHLLKNKLAERPLTACYASDLTRCRIGAEIIAGSRGITPVFDSALRELNIGEWEGLTWQEIQERWPEAWIDRQKDLVNYRVPGGENLLDVHARLMPAFYKIVERHRGEEILVVGHGGVNRIVLLELLGSPLANMFKLEQNYGCHNLIEFYADGRWTVKLVNA